MSITGTGASNYMEMVTPIIPVNMMGEKAEFDDFIAVWPNFVPSAFCNDLIHFFERWEQGACERNMKRDLKPLNHFAGEADAMVGEDQFPDKAAGRKDYAIMLDNLDAMMNARVNQYLQATLNHYCAEYSALAKVPLTSWTSKMQKTPEGGGYHVFHHDNGSWNEQNRDLVWTIYLNEDFEGGETEYLYQKRRIKPTTGTVCIFPGSFTHTHKGNLVLKGTKYIVTGWFYHQPV